MTVEDHHCCSLSGRRTLAPGEPKGRFTAITPDGIAVAPLCGCLHDSADMIAIVTGHAPTVVRFRCPRGLSLLLATHPADQHRQGAGRESMGGRPVPRRAGRPLRTPLGVAVDPERRGRSLYGSVSRTGGACIPLGALMPPINATTGDVGTPIAGTERPLARRLGSRWGGRAPTSDRANAAAGPIHAVRRRGRRAAPRRATLGRLTSS